MTPDIMEMMLKKYLETLEDSHTFGWSEKDIARIEIEKFLEWVREQRKKENNG
jgi:hypothetical protein